MTAAPFKHGATFQARGLTYRFNKRTSLWKLVDKDVVGPLEVIYASYDHWRSSGYSQATPEGVVEEMARQMARLRAEEAGEARRHAESLEKEANRWRSEDWKTAFRKETRARKKRAR